MTVDNDSFVKTERQKHFVELAGELAEQFSRRAKFVDREGVFPFDNFAALKRAGFLSLTIPKQYGGESISLYEFVLIQEKLAQGDASTALSLGWHLGTIMDVAMRTDWEETAFKKLCLDIATGKHLINRVYTEMETGDPSRGAVPRTKATKKNNKWIINGRKSYASMAPALDYVIISAVIEETGEVGGFLVPCRLEGVHIEENWDTLGMRGTRSDNLIFENVELDIAGLVEFVPPKGNQLPLGWLLHIPACYMGIAIAARNEAIRFASVYKPNSLPDPIQKVPEVRRKVGSIDLQLLTARHFLYSVAERWDEEPEKRDKMEAELAAVKYVATNTAVQVVEEAMRIVGGRSLFSSNPMQRYYRDVQAGIYNPPNDDSTISLLANKAFESSNDPTSS